MNAWDIDPDFYLPVFRAVAMRLRAWFRRRRERRAAMAVAEDCTAGCRG